MPKTRRDGSERLSEISGFERLIKQGDSERLSCGRGSKCLNWKIWLWTPKTDKRNGSERLKLEKITLNAYEGKWWLWTPKLMKMALNAYESDDSEWLNLKRWLWMPKIEINGSERLKLKEMALNT